MSISNCSRAVLAGGRALQRAAAIEHRDALPGSHERVGNQRATDSGANHDDIGLYIAGSLCMPNHRPASAREPDGRARAKLTMDGSAGQGMGTFRSGNEKGGRLGGAAAFRRAATVSACEPRRARHLSRRRRRSAPCRRSSRLTFSFQLGIAGDLADTFFNGAFGLMGRALHAILVHIEFLLGGFRATTCGVERLHVESRISAGEGSGLFQASTATRIAPPAMRTIPSQLKLLSLSLRKMAPNTATSTTESLSIGATWAAWPIFRARNSRARRRRSRARRAREEIGPCPIRCRTVATRRSTSGWLR